jgi:YidC/Oxa1 family membrane protein insertase
MAGLIFAVAQAFGGNSGLAIVVVTVTTRLLLLPLTVRLAVHQHQQRDKMTALRPELERLQQRFKDDPAELMSRTMDVYREHDCSPFSKLMAWTMGVQLVVGVSLFRGVSAVARAGGRFLFAQNIGVPHIGMAAIAALTTGAAAFAGNFSASPQKALLAAGVLALITFVMALRFAAGLTLSWGAGAAVSVLQAVLVRRQVRGRYHA